MLMRPAADGKKLLWWREVLVLMDRSLLPEGSVTRSLIRGGLFIDVWNPPSQIFHPKEVVQNTCGLHTLFRYLRAGPDDTPIHPPPRSEMAKRALNHQPGPAQSIIEHPPMVSREWP